MRSPVCSPSIPATTNVSELPLTWHVTSRARVCSASSPSHAEPMVQGKAPAGDAAGRHTKQHSKGMRLQAEATAALLGADYDEEDEDDDFDVDGRVSEDEEEDEDEEEEDEEQGEAAAAAGDKKRKARSGGGAKKRGASAFIDDAAAEDDDEEEEEEVRCGVLRCCLRLGGEP